MTHLVYCIKEYDSAKNYNTRYGKALYKYLFKVFYNQTNKKEY